LLLPGVEPHLSSPYPTTVPTNYKTVILYTFQNGEFLDVQKNNFAICVGVKYDILFEEPKKEEANKQYGYYILYDLYRSLIFYDSDIREANVGETRNIYRIWYGNF
jgi:uncharacterized protein (DUF2225 family)